MPVQAPLSDTSRQKLDGIVAQMQKNGESDSYIQGVVNDFKSKYSGVGVKAQPKSTFEKVNDWGNDTVDSAMSFLGDELSGVAHAVNPVNVVKGVANTIAHPIDTAVALAKTPGTMYQQFKDGDLEGLANTIGNVAGGVIVGKVMPEVPGAVKSTANAASKYGSRVAANAPAVADAATTVARSVAPDVAKGAVANVIPGVGHGLSLALLYKAASKVVKDGSLGDLKSSIGDLLKPTAKEIYDATKDRKPLWDDNPNPPATPAATAPATPAATPGFGEDGTFTLPSGRVLRKPGASQPAAQPPPTTNVTISPKVSVESATDTMGTKAPSEAPSTGLDATTHQQLIDATRSGTLKALPAEAKATLTRAVKAGDNAKVRSILGGRLHSALSKTDDAVINKVAVLVKYAQDHGIDLETIAPEDRQALADKALDYGKKNGMNVPKRSYNGISDDSFNMVKQKLAGK